MMRCTCLRWLRHVLLCQVLPCSLPMLSCRLHLLLAVPYQPINMLSKRYVLPSAKHEQNPDRRESATEGDGHTASLYYSQHLSMPAQRQAEVLGTLTGTVRLTYVLTNQSTLCSFVGIGSGHRQLIAVTCIAEHA